MNLSNKIIQTYNNMKILFARTIQKINLIMKFKLKLKNKILTNH